jgi:hypothetical protein
MPGAVPGIHVLKVPKLLFIKRALRKSTGNSRMNARVKLVSLHGTRKSFMGWNSIIGCSWQKILQSSLPN